MSGNVEGFLYFLLDLLVLALSIPLEEIVVFQAKNAKCVKWVLVLAILS